MRATLAAPRPGEIDPSASGCGASGDLVESRVANLIDLHLRSPVHHFREGLQHCWIGVAAVSFRVLFSVPQTDSQRLRSVWDNERDFALEAILFSKQRNDFLVKRAGKFRNAIGLQMNGYISAKHWQPPCGCGLSGAITDDLT